MATNDTNPFPLYVVTRNMPVHYISFVHIWYFHSAFLCHQELWTNRSLVGHEKA